MLLEDPIQHCVCVRVCFCFVYFNKIFLKDFLVKFLEQEVCKLNWDVGFVTVTMQEIGVQLPRLLEVYDQLFKARVRGAPSDGYGVFVLTSRVTG